jgi:ribonuclease E
LVAVPMTDEQEQVFGWLGLSPALLLETPPEADNVMVRVVRPGESEEAVLEEARQQLTASSNRRRRRGGRGGGRGTGRSNGSVETTTTASSAHADTASAPLLVEITPLEATFPVVDSSRPADKASEPASLSVGSDAPEAPEGASASVPEVSDTDQEPRRRRRRSSAAVAD